MKKTINIWSAVSIAGVILGMVSVGRVASELVRHTAGRGGIALHIGSAVLWFLIAFLCSHRKKKRNAPEIPPSELASSIQKKLGLPYKLLPDRVPSDTLYRFFRKTRKEGQEQGFTPILVPVSAALDAYLDTAKERGHEAADILQTPAEDGKAVLDRRMKAALGGGTDQISEELLGEMAGGEELISFTSCRDRETDRPIETLLLRIPSERPWEAVAYVPFDQENGCPPPAEMLAVCKYWYEAYQAVPAALTHHSLEFILPRAIDKESAWDVAKEQFAFCRQRVDQGTKTGTVGELADSLWQSNLWYFRWDGEEKP